MGHLIPSGLAVPNALLSGRKEHSLCYCCTIEEAGVSSRFMT